MTRTGTPPVLITGATGRVGRVVGDQLIEAGAPSAPAQRVVFLSSPHQTPHPFFQRLRAGL